ncbi:MAG TPA: BatA domain-containing protein [Vicinamibacterales bacterium]|nr:BatA domain-containing protein [Vicinamibacterales bacterium]
MVWLLPAALAGLAAVVAPLIIHLLRRQRARTVVIPTVRFIPAVDQSVVRIRRPADLALLLVRMAVIALAALALARPLVLTPSRAAGWADRIARVTVVDISNPSAAPLANEAAAAELASATFSHRIDTTELAPALRQGSAWLNGAPPARRELVVISDFRLGAIDESLVRGVPDTIGLRLVPVRSKQDTIRDIAAGSSLGPEVVFRTRVRIDAETTSATFSTGPGAIEGLTLLVAPEDQAEAAKLLRVVGHAGARAPSSSQPIVVRFTGGAPLSPPEKQTQQQWATAAALRLLKQTDANSLPVTAGVGGDGTLLVDVNAAPGTLTAAEALKTVLDAREDPEQLSQQEIALVPTEKLEALGRPAPPADTSAWQRTDESDGRWLWLAALVLLGVEAWIRRGPASAVTAPEVGARAA